MDKLFEKRIGAYFQASPIRTIPNVKGDIWASWPFSKLTLYKDKMVIKVAARGTFTLAYKNIKNLEKITLGIKINHNDKKIKPYVYITGVANGSSLFKEILKVIAENKLSIKRK